MLRLVLLAVVTALVGIGGCGTSATGTTLDEAREACLPFVDDPDEFDIIVIVYRAIRDDGATKLQAIAVSVESCAVTDTCAEDDPICRDDCEFCTIKVIDAIYP